MKKLSVKKLITVLTVFVLSLGMFCFSGCNTEKQNKEEVEKNEYSIFLTSSDAQVVDTGDEVYIEKTLKATVTAQDSNADTYINWTASWSNSEVAENVSDYLKVLPTTLGSTTAKVRCYKNFDEFGEIVIKAIARVDSTKYATCIATYIGAPESFDIKDGTVSISGTTIIAEPEEPNYFTLDLFNKLGVGSEYGNYDFEVVSCSGTVYLNQNMYDFNGDLLDSVYYLPLDASQDLSLIKFEDMEIVGDNDFSVFNSFDSYFETYFIDAEHNELFFVTYSLKEIRETIVILDDTSLLSGNYTFEGVSDDFIFTVKVTEKKSKKSVSFNIHIDIPVSDTSKIPTA